MASKFPFPFFGQGDAGYYEWFEMWVWFVDPVPVAKRAALVKLAPKLCRLDAQWPNGELLWSSTGDQWIQQHLVAEYGTAVAKKKMAKSGSLKNTFASQLTPWDSMCCHPTSVS